MVNGKVIRGAGLVILVGSYIWMDSTFTNNVVKKADSLFAELVGEGRGSMYNVRNKSLHVDLFVQLQISSSQLNLLISPKTCSEESKTLKKLTSVNLAEKASSDLKYNFYSINNPKEYLGGDDATVVEKGPYILRYVPS